MTQKVSSIQMLTESEELELIRDFQATGNRASLKILTESHLHLIIACAKSVPLGQNMRDDLIQEGVFGFWRAVELFDESMSRRLSVLAKFHVKARMQDYALKNMSSVKPFNTRKQRRAFFHFKKLQGDGDRLLTPEERNALAVELGVDDDDIDFVSSRLNGGDVNLDGKIGDSEMSFGETIADEAPLPDATLIARDENVSWTMKMRLALATLPDREREILSARRLLDPPTSLQELAERFSVSRGRVSQIETAAFEKLKTYIRDTSSNEYQQPLRRSA